MISSTFNFECFSSGLPQRLGTIDGLKEPFNKYLVFLTG